jgi:hypothetical protein
MCPKFTFIRIYHLPFRVPQEFAHYKRPERLKQFFRLFYYQLIEQGY